jgi:hypothetical protein
VEQRRGCFLLVRPTGRCVDCGFADLERASWFFRGRSVLGIGDFSAVHRRAALVLAETDLMLLSSRAGGWDGL